MSNLTVLRRELLETVARNPQQNGYQIWRKYCDQQNQGVLSEDMGYRNPKGRRKIARQLYWLRHHGYIVNLSFDQTKLSLVIAPTGLREVIGAKPSLANELLDHSILGDT